MIIIKSLKSMIEIRRRVSPSASSLTLKRGSSPSNIIIFFISFFNVVIRITLIFSFLMLLLMFNTILCHDLLTSVSSEISSPPSSSSSAIIYSMRVTLSGVNNQINSQMTRSYNNHQDDDKRISLSQTKSPSSPAPLVTITQEEKDGKIVSPSSQVIKRETFNNNNNKNNPTKDDVILIRVKRGNNGNNNRSRNTTTRRVTNRNVDNRGFDDSDDEDFDEDEEENSDDSHHFDKELLLARSSIPMSPADAYRKKMKELAARTNARSASASSSPATSSRYNSHESNDNGPRIHITIQTHPSTSSSTTTTPATTTTLIPVTTPSPYYPSVPTPPSFLTTPKLFTSSYENSASATPDPLLSLIPPSLRFPSVATPPAPPTLPSINSPLASILSPSGPSDADPPRHNVMMRYAHAAGTPASFYFMHHSTPPSPFASPTTPDTNDSLAILKYNTALHNMYTGGNSLEDDGGIAYESPSREYRRGRRVHYAPTPDDHSSVYTYDHRLSYATTVRPVVNNHLGSDSFRNTNYYKTPTLEVQRDRNAVRPSVSSILDPPKERKQMIHSCILSDFQKYWEPRFLEGSTADDNDVDLQKTLYAEEIQTTCKAYVEKIEEMRSSCLQAIHDLRSARIATRNKWWERIPFRGKKRK